MRGLKFGRASQTWTVDHNGLAADASADGLSSPSNSSNSDAHRMQSIRNRNTSKWKKFRLLIWKNWTIQRRHPWQIFFEIFFPIFCSVTLIITRAYIPAELIPIPTEYHQFYVDTPPWETVQDMCNEIYYAPTNPATDKLMQEIRDNYFKFGDIKEYKVTGFNSEADLLAKYNEVSLRIYKRQNDSYDGIHHNPVLAGVVFTNSFESSNSDAFPENVKYTLRFPAKQRSEFDLLTERFGLKPAWYTDLIYPFLKLPGPRARLSANGGLPGYYAEGFLYLQYAIDTTITKSVLNDAEELDAYKNYEIGLQRYPYPPYIEDKFTFSMQGVFPIIILLSFIYPVINTTRCIVLEKEKRLKESMKMMGLSSYLHWCAWIIRSFTFLIVAVLLMTIFLTSPIAEQPVMQFSDPVVLFFIMLSFSIQAVAMAFFVTTLTNTANVGAVLAAVLWFICFVPYTMLEPRYYTMSRFEKMSASLITTSPICFLCFMISTYESRGTGLHWADLMHGVGPGDDFCPADCFLLILVNAFLYFIAALYCEAVWPGEFGIALPWNYVLKKWYWTNGIPDKHVHSASATSATPKHLLEPEPKSYAGVKIEGLSKTFGKKAAVKNLHLNMYEDQITALLGHNGAGKSTTISMLTGLYPQSAGTAFIHGFDIENEMNSVRSSLGICPQHDVLFDELTVEEHLRFFCLLKGFPDEAVVYESNRIIKLLGLYDKKSAQSHTLSGGMKRKLSVSIAFCAGSKVVLLDEPTSGMDPSARRSCWDLIQTFKKGRTVLLSTHFMEEADLLGDRIAIMADGELQCCGSSLFLKKKYGGGYHLTIVKDEDCNVDRITDLLKNRIPNVEVDQNVGAELTYSLPDEKSNLFPEMFEELENRKTELGIASYGASITTMEEVFIRVGREAERKIAEAQLRDSNSNSLSRSSISDATSGSTGNGHVGVTMNGIDSNSKTNLHEHTRRNRGLALFGQQFQAMVVKKLIYIKRNPLLVLVQMGLPVLVLFILLSVAPTFPGLGAAPPLSMTMQTYEKFGKTFTPIHCDTPSALCEAFKDTLSSDGFALKDSENDTLSNYLIERGIMDITFLSYRYIVGYEETASNDSSAVKVTGFFNNEQPHSLPLIYNMVNNAILKSLDKNVTLEVTNFPFPYTKLEQGAQSGDFYSLGFLVGYNLTFGMSFLAATFVVFIVTERASRSKHLQYIAGVKFYTFWLANYVVDFVCFMIPCIIIQIMLHIFKIQEYMSMQMTFNMFLMFVVFASCMLPFVYLLSFAFSEPTNAFIRVGMLNVFTGKVAMVVYAVVTIADFKLEQVGDALNDAFMTIPVFAFGNGLVQMAKNVLLKEQCDANFDTPESLEFSCALFANNLCCTTVKENLLEWEVNGIGKNICSLVVYGVVSAIILVLCELRVWEYFKKASKQQAENTSKNGLDDLIVEDEDVAAERERIRKTDLNKLHQTDNLILRDLTKYYKKFLAVDKLNLGVQRGQTFGLLGINGAGKTTTFKMLTGDYPCSSGDAFIYSHSIRHDIKGVHRHSGYCPQFDGLIGEMTGRETLTMYGRLRGIWEDDMEAMISKIARDLIFTEHLDKVVKTYSGGNKRKLSTAMALVGNPPIVFLDEPSTGMDPVARRHLWNAITVIRESGTSVVLTSHSLEECEVLCSRLAIMVNGVFRCLGSPQHLKNKFGEGYTIIAQCPPVGVGEDFSRAKQESGLRRSASLILRKSTAPQKWEKALDGLRAFIEESFPSGSLKDIHPGFIHYHVRPSPDVTWGKLFEKMEIAKDKFKLDAYSVGQTSLEQVFLNFAKSQINTE